jgi:hypothetical protein
LAGKIKLIQLMVSSWFTAVISNMFGGHESKHHHFEPLANQVF